MIRRILAATLLCLGILCLGQSSDAQLPLTHGGRGVGLAALSCSYTPITTATQSVAYTGATPSSSGGTPAYVYSISAGTLPTGFSLNTSTGVISGTDSSIETKTGIQLTVTDNVSATANCGGTFAITVSASTVIASIQPCNFTMAAAATTGHCTLSHTVTAAKALVMWNGRNGNGAGVNYGRVDTYLQLKSDGTEVDGTRGNATTDNVTLQATVIEFSSGVNSINYGTIAITATNTSATCTLNSTCGGTQSTATCVSGNCFIVWLGLSEATGTLSDGSASFGLTYNSGTGVVTAITGLANPTVTTTVGFAVVDLDSTIVTGVVASPNTSQTANTATDTDTVSTVTTANTILVYNGSTFAGAGDVGPVEFTNILTGTTTVTNVRNSTGTTARVHYYTLVSLAAGAMTANAVQRCTPNASCIAVSSGTGTATITSVGFSATPTSNKAFVNWNNFEAASANINVTQPKIVLTNATTVTASTDSGSGVTARVGFEVVDFK